MPRRYSSTAVAPRRASAAPRRASFSSTLLCVERTWTCMIARSGIAIASTSTTNRGTGERGRTSFREPSPTKGPQEQGPESGWGLRPVPVFRLPAVHAVLEEPEQMPCGAEGIERSEPGAGHADDAPVVVLVERGDAGEPTLLAPESHVLGEHRAMARDHAEIPAAGVRELRLRVRGI